VGAIEANREPDPTLPAKALLRSRHNNYLTLPVLFIMISNHFPSTYGSASNWMILAALAVLSVLVRHYFNTRHESQKLAWTLPAAALGMVALAFVTRPDTAPTTVETAGHTLPAAVQGVEFDAVYNVIQQRCTSCHSATPTSPAFSTAPGGVIMDEPSQIKQLASRIHAQAVASNIMPLGNITNMTQDERNLLGNWIAAGAPTE
jgi:uncharacterized membrane protein